MKDRVEKIRCDEDGCASIVAERRADGTIIIRAKHHGETHITIIEPQLSQENTLPDAPLADTMPSLVQ